MMAAHSISLPEAGVQPEPSDTVVCPSCGEENIRGSDTCGHCLADLTAGDVPVTAQAGSASELTLPLSAVRLSKPLTIDQSATVREAVALLAGEPSGGLVVLAGDAVAGIFTERDVLKKVAGHNERLDDAVSQHMTADPVVLREDDTMAVALNKMGDGGFRHIPLVRDGRPVALVTARDVLSWVLGRFFD